MRHSLLGALCDERAYILSLVRDSSNSDRVTGPPRISQYRRYGTHISIRQYLLLPSQDAQDGCILLVGDARSPSCTLKQPLLIWCELSLHATRVGDGCLITGNKLVQCTRSLNGSWKRRERTPIQVDVLLFHLGDQQYL